MRFSVTLRMFATVALFCLVGCGNPPIFLQRPLEPSAAKQPESAFSIPQNGGKFSASYAGNARCCRRHVLRFSGSGKATFLLASTEQGKINGSCSQDSCTWTGSATLTSQHIPSDSVAMSLSFKWPPDPCIGNPVVDWIVTGGSGKFQHATGSGSLTFKCEFNGVGPYTDGWTGTLNY
jgi:hypothetical protein